MADEEWEEGGDAATEAFEQVRVAVEQQRGELALMRRAIEGLAAERTASTCRIIPRRWGMSFRGWTASTDAWTRLRRPS